MLKFLVTIIVVSLTLILASTIDHGVDNPGKTAESHIEENLHEIRELVRETLGENTLISQGHTVLCWQENNPALIPSEKYTVQQCRIRFGPTPHGDVQAIYTVTMGDWTNPWTLFKHPNHPVADAYLDKETVRAFPENRRARLTEK